jgi:hypothetical protein
MKKTIFLLGVFLSLNLISYGQQKLSKKEGTKILEAAWNDVKNSDTAGFIKLWVLDDTQWPYHGGEKFTVKDVKYNFADFRSYFDSALIGKLKFSEVECDTVEHSDAHYDYAKYYIKAWFRYSKNHVRGFGFYMDYVNNQWLIRFAPDYSDVTAPKKVGL